jgi:hypothetical protein
VVLVAAVVLVACQPEPVEVASYANQRTLTSMSGNGRYVVVGTQNDDVTQACTASLSIEARDVNGNGKLDESGDTSYVTYFGKGGSVSGIANIDDASLSVPSISSDGPTLVFEAYDPANTAPPSQGLAPVNDCVYEVAVADLGSVPPSLVDCSTSGLASGSYLDNFMPGYMDPTVSDAGEYVGYVRVRIRFGVPNVAVYAVNEWSKASGTAVDATVMADGTTPSSVSNPTGLGRVGFPRLSSDGRYLVVTSSWPLTDYMRSQWGDYGPSEAYVYDRVTAQTRDLTLDTVYPDTANPNIGSGYADISHDGRFVSLIQSVRNLDPNRSSTGPWAPVYLLDRDVTGAVDGSGDLAMDQSGNTAMGLVSNGDQLASATRIDSGTTVVGGQESVARVAWSFYSVDGQAQSAVQPQGAGSADKQLLTPHGPVPGVRKGPSLAPMAQVFPAMPVNAAPAPPQVGTTSTTLAGPVTTSTTVAEAGTTSSIPSTSTTVSSGSEPGPVPGPSATTPSSLPSAASPGSSGVGLLSGTSWKAPTSGADLVSYPRLAGKRSRTATGATVPQPGGLMAEIRVLDLSTGAVSVTDYSGLGKDSLGNPDPGLDYPMVHWEMSADGQSLSWEIVDSALTSHALYRQLVFPWVSQPASTFGFQPYDAYASDPVNVATGSFTNAATDLTSPQGVYGMDFSRTYNSADPNRTEFPSTEIYQHLTSGVNRTLLQQRELPAFSGIPIGLLNTDPLTIPF